MTELRLWPATSGPGTQATDNSDYALGVEFYVTSPANVTKIHFWASTARSGTYTGRVYAVTEAVTNGTAGTAVTGTDVTFGAITGPGWNTATLTTPVTLTVNQNYRAVVQFNTNDGYTSTAGFWTVGGDGEGGITNGLLVAPDAELGGAIGGKQGSWVESSSMAFPTNTATSNYWIDVTVEEVITDVTGSAAITLGGLTLSVDPGYLDEYDDDYGELPAHEGVAHCALGGLSLSATLSATPPPVDPDVGGLNLSLWAVSGSGVLTPLPHFTNLTLSRERNGLGRISVDYPYYGRNFDLLAANITNDRDLEVEIWVSGQRAGALRGILCDTAGDDVAEDAVWRFEGHFLELLLDEVLAWNQPAAEKQELVFSTATAGSIAATILTQAQTRGGLVGVTRDFTTSLDSNGDAWASVVTVHFSPTATFLDILQELIEIGMIDGFELTGGRTLRLWNPGGQGTDLTVSPPSTGAPIFRRGRNLTQSPRRHTVRNSATAALAVGADNVYEAAVDASALARRGRRIEIAGSANSLSDSGSVTAYAQSLLTGAAVGTHEVTHGIVFGTGHPRPLIDFGNADWVWSDTRGELERLRVWQLELEDGAAGYAGTVVLNTPITDRMVALARKLKRMSSGTAVVGTSTVAPEVDDGKAPAQVTGLTAASTAYLTGEGTTFAAVQAGWTAVTTNADASAADDIAGYFVAFRYLGGAPLPTAWQAAPSVTANAADWSGVLPGKSVGVRVAAYDRYGRVGAWSAEYTLTTGADATPPPTPSTPVVENYLGILTVTWDGEGSVGEPMPVDFDRVDVHISTSSGFGPGTSTLVDSLRTKGVIPWDGGSYGVTYYAKLIAYDKTGNASAASAQDSAVLTQAADGDISAVSIGKLSAGIMSAIMTISGIIRTASSGDRVEIDADGIHCYDGSTLVFDFDISAGTVYMRGTVEAYQGPNDRIVVQPSGAGASGASLSEISFFANPTSPGYINGFGTTGARTGLGMNSGNSADSGTTRNQSTLRLFPASWNLFVNTAPGDAAGPNQPRGAEVSGSPTEAVLRMVNGAGAEYGKVGVGIDTVDAWLNDGSGNREGGFLWLRRDTDDTYLGHHVPGTVDAYIKFVGNDGLITLQNDSSGHVTLAGGGTLTLSAGGNTFIKLNPGGNLEFFENGLGYASLATLKSFVIDHPTDPDRLLVHVCTESPTAGVEYTGTAVVRGGAATVQLPTYFEALCEPGGRTVQLTPVGVLCRVASQPIVDGRFTVLSDAPNGTRVDWHVRATRRNTRFEVEPLRSEVHVAGAGPYRWISPEPTLTAAAEEPPRDSPHPRPGGRRAAHPRRPA